MKIEDWFKAKRLNYRIIKSPRLFEIKGFGRLFYIDDDRSIFTEEEGELIVDLEIREVDYLRKKKVAYVAFPFGNQIYYAPVPEDGYIQMNLNLLAYVGEPITASLIKDAKGYCSLGVHEEYELFNGGQNSSEWAEKAKFLGMKALGLRSLNTLAGTVNFQIECDKIGVKPIMGETITIKYPKERLAEGVVYVMNEKGWRNLLKINFQINVQNIEGDGKGESSWVDYQFLFEHAEGLIFVFNNASILNSFSQKERKFKFWLKEHKRAFEQCYFQFDGVRYSNEAFDKMQLDAKKTYLEVGRNIVKPILVKDEYFLEKEDLPIKVDLNEMGKVRKYYSADAYMSPYSLHTSSLRDLFNKKDIRYDEILDDGISSLKKVVKSCNFKLEIGLHKLPEFKFDGEKPKDIPKFFRKLAHKGLKEKGKTKKKYIKQLDKELDVIIGAGFIDYFLILWDAVKWAKQNGHVVGNGRGSVVGSLLAFALDITTVDPMEYDLLFERFINEARISGERAKSADALPDIDLDFESDKRDIIKGYFEHKYGKNNVCSIGAYGRIKLKAGIKDFGRLEGLDFAYVNKVTRDIPDKVKPKLNNIVEYCLSENHFLRNFLQEHPKLFRKLITVLGQTRHMSIHASAIIVVPDHNKQGEQNLDVSDWLPTKKINGMLVSEWEGAFIDRVGFLKEDILGLSQLDKFNAILKLIKRNRKKEIILEEIPLDNLETYEYFHNGWNEDVFQFTSDGLKAYSKKVKPDNIEDLIAMNALFRPGPMQSNAHTEFADIKHGKMEPDYDYGLKEVTENTFGLYAYQEQIMRAVVVLGGFTLVESDQLRTYIKKFKKAEMEKSHAQFVKGAIKNGCPKDEAEIIWDKLVAFGSYGFNKSHATAYSIMAYWSQWLKVHYPLEFWTVALQRAPSSEVATRLSEIQKTRPEIKLRPCDINKSGSSFECDKKTNSIYFSITGIKGLGEASVKEIMEKRTKGAFKDLADFYERIEKRKVNKAKVVTLILSGAFDELEDIEKPSERKELVRKFCIISGNDFKKYDEELMDENDSYYTVIQKKLTGFGEVNFRKILKEVTSKWREYISGEDFMSVSHTKSKKFGRTNKQTVILCGYIKFIDQRKTKKGKDYLRVSFISDNDKITIFIWEEQMDSFASELKENSWYAIRGELNTSEDFSNSMFLNDSSAIWDLNEFLK